MAFDIEAHRGGRALFPENTLQSFANALSMGVNTLELDIGVTRDGAIIVSHERKLNPDLARDADGVYVAPPGTPFVQLSLDEVKKYDVGQIRPGSAYAAQFPDQHAVPGTPIPTLIEVFDLVRKSGDEHVRFNIETKIDPNHPDESPDPQRFVACCSICLQAQKFSDRVMVQSFDWRTLQLVQKQAPDDPDGLSDPAEGIGRDESRWTRPRSGRRASIRPTTANRCRARSRPRAARSGRPISATSMPSLISESHQLGLKVVVWTVNKPEDIARMIDIGVDGIISDHPDLLRKIAGEKGIALPAGHPVTP